MPEKIACMIVDLDGTLADCRWRRHYVEKSDNQEQRNWSAFFDGIAQDKPTAIRYLIRDLWNSLRILYVSGRPNSYRDVSVQWLRKYGLWNYGPDLFMRPTGDRRPDTEIKKEILTSILVNYNPILVIDDRPEVVQMWLEEGLTVLQVHLPKEQRERNEKNA